MPRMYEVWGSRRNPPYLGYQSCRCRVVDGMHRAYLGYTADADAGPDDNPGHPLRLLLPEERPMDLKKPPPTPLSAPACCWARTTPPPS